MSGRQEASSGGVGLNGHEKLSAGQGRDWEYELLV